MLTNWIYEVNYPAIVLSAVHPHRQVTARTKLRGDDLKAGERIGNVVQHSDAKCIIEFFRSGNWQMSA